MPMAGNGLEQIAWRFRFDTVAPAVDAGWMAAKDTNVEVWHGLVFRARILVQKVSDTTFVTSLKIQRKYEEGLNTWDAMSRTTEGVHTERTDGHYVGKDDAVINHLGNGGIIPGNGSLLAYPFGATGNSVSWTVISPDSVEIESCMRLDPAVSVGHTIKLRARKGDGGALDRGYNVPMTMTVVAPPDDAIGGAGGMGQVVKGSGRILSAVDGAGGMNAVVKGSGAVAAAIQGAGYLGPVIKGAGVIRPEGD